MLQNLFKTFGKTLLYAVVGVLLWMLTAAITNYHPDPGLPTYIWQYAVLPAFIGLVKLLKRLLTWDPAKAGA
jgi:hypothetical protein